MSQTWSSTGARSAKAVCTTGSESAPSAATDGMDLTGVSGFGLKAEADAGQTISGAGALQAWLYDDVSTRWARCPDLDVSMVAVATRQQAWPGFSVLSPRGRIAYVPVGVTVSSGGVTIYLNATAVSGQAL